MDFGLMQFDVSFVMDSAVKFEWNFEIISLCLNAQNEIIDVNILSSWEWNMIFFFVRVWSILLMFKKKMMFRNE